jgi:predicted GH43/DUF377 family glycosyl hydrolase
MRSGLKPDLITFFTQGFLRALLLIVQVMADFAMRFAQNPLVTPDDIAASQDNLVVECVMNPGVFKFDGLTWLIVRVAERPAPVEGKITFPFLDKNGVIKSRLFDTNDPRVTLSDPRYVRYNGVSYLSTVSHLCLLCSADGVHFHEPEGYPTRLTGRGSLESYGIEDCRVTQIDGTYYLTFTEVSPSGVGVGLMETRDWQQIQRRGMIFPPHNKDCAIFPEKVDGRYLCFNRPSGIKPGGHYMWISSSHDLIHWGRHSCILHTREGMWDCERVGAGAAPVRTPYGWLTIYHGADADHRYCLGAILLDANDPTKVLARSVEPIMEPLETYEKEGFFGNVIFTNGHTVDHDRWILYYGASDTVICGAEFSITGILESLKL